MNFINLLVSFSIISLLSINPASGQRTPDTSAFKKEFELLLKKYGISNEGYMISVKSNNQHGGQTAFIINNNYYGDTLAYQENVDYKIRKIGKDSVLSIWPKKGVWASPFVLTDSSVNMKNRVHISHMTLTFPVTDYDMITDGKKIVLRGSTYSNPSSVTQPINVVLTSKKEEFFIIGDMAEYTTKAFVYHQGKVTYFAIK